MDNMGNKILYIFVRCIHVSCNNKNKIANSFSPPAREEKNLMVEVLILMLEAKNFAADVDSPSQSDPEEFDK